MLGQIRQEVAAVSCYASRTLTSNTYPQQEREQVALSWTVGALPHTPSWPSAVGKAWHVCPRLHGLIYGCCGLQVLLRDKMNVLLLLLPLAIVSHALRWPAGVTFVLSLLPLCSLAEVGTQSSAQSLQRYLRWPAAAAFVPVPAGVHCRQPCSLT